MHISTDSYRLRTAGFSEETLKSVLAGAAGLNPRLTTMEISLTEHYKVKLEEKIIQSFAPSATPVEELVTEDNIKFVLGQLDAWTGSKSQGNAMTERAALLIRALNEKLNEKKD